VKANGDLLVLELMRFEHELVPAAAIKLSAGKKPRARELGMARTLVNQMSEDWDPHRYTDEYRSALMKLIDRKVASGGKALPSEGRRPKAATNVIDLAAVLRQSLAGGAPRRRRTPGRGRARAKAA
jgi:DNA end-binding protein Ku